MEKIKEMLEYYARQQKHHSEPGKEIYYFGECLNAYLFGKQDGRIELARELLLILNQKELFE